MRRCDTPTQDCVRLFSTRLMVFANRHGGGALCWMGRRLTAQRWSASKNLFSAMQFRGAHVVWPNNPETWPQTLPQQLRRKARLRKIVHLRTSKSVPVATKITIAAASKNGYLHSPVAWRMSSSCLRSLFIKHYPHGTCPCSCARPCLCPCMALHLDAYDLLQSTHGAAPRADLCNRPWGCHQRNTRCSQTVGRHILHLGSGAGLRLRFCTPFWCL